MSRFSVYLWTSLCLQSEWTQTRTALPHQPGRYGLLWQSPPALCLSGSLLSPHLHTAANAAALPLPLLLFQVCLNRTGCRCQFLHIFMDTFQGHYKDGTNGTRDLRFFSGLYLLLRVVVYTSIVVTYQIASYAYTTNVIVVAAVSVALAQPYKNYYYNFIDASLLILLTMLYVTLLPMVFYHSQQLRLA